jgi:hypothetical protein
VSRQNLNEAQDQLEKQKRPFYLIGTALALIAVGVWNLIVFSLFVFLRIFHHYMRNTLLVPVLIGVGTIVSVALVASGIGVIRGAGWSRALAIPCLLFLCVKAAFPVLFGHGRISGYGWAGLVFYLCISLLLVTRGASAFFGVRRAKT